MNKPVIIFSNFWDAEKLLQRGNLLFYKGDSIYKVAFHTKPYNYTINSIALAHPSLEKMTLVKERNGTIDKLPRLDCFCPTYELLMGYKNGGEWSDYVIKYRSLMKSRKNDIKLWFKSLLPDHVYILCCWENTSKGAHCHRDLMYDAFTQSKVLKDMAIYIQRSGSWNDHYENEGIYRYFDKYLSGQESIIPVTMDSQAFADAMGVAVGETIGTGLSDGASWTVTPNGNIYPDLVESLFHEITPVSVGTTIVPSGSMDEHLP